METIEATFRRSDTVHFLVDDDPDMEWISGFPCAQERLFLIIDEAVARRHPKVLQLLKKRGQEMFILRVKGKESSKSLSFYPRVLGFLEKHRANLSDLVIAAGGGTILDLVSFTCSTYMRGLPFFMIPTTLMGQVDSSTAGKTCLNTPMTKNLLGTFYYPLVVYNNTRFLDTVHECDQRQGFSEVFKYGLLRSPSLVQALREYHAHPAPALLKRIIIDTIGVRIAVRKIHPQASNLGHTFGHALEALSGYRILHGDAISAGTAVALHFAVEKGWMPKLEMACILSIMKELGLNLYIDDSIDSRTWLEAMRRDKKSSATKVNLVLIQGIGKPIQGSFFSISFADLRKFLDRFLASYPYKMRNCHAMLKKGIAYAH